MKKNPKRFVWQYFYNHLIVGAIPTNQSTPTPKLASSVAKGRISNWDTIYVTDNENILSPMTFTICNPK
jgi:hypothetical protein